MAWFKSQIDVTLINDATGEILGVTRMPPANLPESFEVATTLHLGEEEWSVVDAQPQTRQAYSKSKRLLLRLRRIEMVDPRTILFSLPSICKVIPKLGEEKLAGNELQIAEDDWRQVEFVSAELAPAVDDEIAKIRLIHENCAASVGWREIHVRAEPVTPIVCDLSLPDLATALGVEPNPIGITYYGAPSRIADGYAFTSLEGVTIYGVAPSAKVRVIAFAQFPDQADNSLWRQRLQSLVRDISLHWVHWCRCIRAATDDPLFLMSDN
jgi:hypothetical protein